MSYSMSFVSKERWEATFSSQSKGRCKRISIGSVSAVRMMSSAIPRFRVFVARKSVNEKMGFGRGQGETTRHTLVSTLFKLLILGSLICELQNLVPVARKA